MRRFVWCKRWLCTPRRDETGWLMIQVGLRRWSSIGCVMTRLWCQLASFQPACFCSTLQNINKWAQSPTGKLNWHINASVIRIIITIQEYNSNTLHHNKWILLSRLLLEFVANFKWRTLIRLPPPKQSIKTQHE